MWLLSQQPSCLFVTYFSMHVFSVSSNTCLILDSQSLKLSVSNRPAEEEVKTSTYLRETSNITIRPISISYLSLTLPIRSPYMESSVGVLCPGYMLLLAVLLEPVNSMCFSNLSLNNSEFLWACLKTHCLKRDRIHARICLRPNSCLGGITGVPRILKISIHFSFCSYKLKIIAKSK